MSKGFRKDKSIAEFSITTMADDCVVNSDLDTVIVLRHDAAVLFNALKDVYQILSHVLGNTTVIEDFGRCLQCYHKTLLK